MVLLLHKVFGHIKSFFEGREIMTQGEQQFLQWGGSDKYRDLMSECVRFSSVVCKLFSVMCVHREVRADGLSVGIRVSGYLHLQHHHQHHCAKWLLRLLFFFCPLHCVGTGTCVVLQ